MVLLWVPYMETRLLGVKGPLWGFSVAGRAFSGSAIGSLYGSKAFWTGKGFYMGLLGPRRSRSVAQEVVRRFAPYMETRLFGWERHLTGLLGLRESPCVTYGSAKEFPIWKQGFGVGKSLDGASWSPEEPLAALL